MVIAAPAESEVARIPETVVAPEAPWPSPLRSGLLLALLLVLYTLSFIDRWILVLLIEPLKQDLVLTDLQVSLLIGAAFSVLYATAGVPLGYLADRANRRNLIAVGVSLWSLMTAAGGMAGSFLSLFVTRMGVGLGEAALSPAAYSMLTDSYPRNRLSRALATYTIGSSLGSGLALVVGGLLLGLVTSPAFQQIPGVSALSPWRLALFLAGAPGLVLAGLLLLMREPARRAYPQAGRGAKAWPFLVQHRALVLPLFFGVAVHTAVMYGASAWAPTLFSRTFGIAPASAAIPLGLIQALCGTLGMLAGAGWTDRLVARGASGAHMRVLLVGTAVGGLFFLLAPLAPTPELAYAALAVAFTFGMFQGGVVPAGLQLVTPAHLRGRTIALYLMTMSLVGLGVGPTIVAAGTTYLFGESGIGSAMVMASLMLSPVACLLLFLARRPFREALAEAAPDAPR